MPHGAVRLADGVNTNRTPTLNEFGLSAANLIRYQYDNTGAPLVQKRGGWTRFYPTPLSGIARALWGWEDINANARLAYGTQGAPAELGVITNGARIVITPTTTTDNVSPAASSTEGSAVVTITDNTVTGITSFDTVYIETHLSIGGVVLFGMYPTTQLSSNAYDVTAVDKFGNPIPAPQTSTSASVASFATTSGSSVVTVTLNAHGYNPGDTYPVLVSTAVGGVTLFGDYVVQSVIDANNFTILAATQATSSTSASINGGHVRFLYSFGVGAIPAGSGYGAGGFGLGGYGTGTGITPATGTPISATNWSLDNWGEVLLSCPVNGSLFQPIFAWDPTSGSTLAQVIPEAPPNNDGFFVAMPQRQIVAWGSTFTGIQDPLLIRWCDVNNFFVWTAQVTNQAGSFRLTRGSKIVAGIQGPQQGLIWTDIGIWSMQYIGGQGGEAQLLVYSFNELATGCGLIAKKAAASLNGAIYWMGPTQFFVLNANGVQPIPCPVWDEIFQELDTSNLDKIRVAVNSRFNEIEWFYPTLSSGGEIGASVKYNAAIGFWDINALARSAWIDQSVLGPPIGADPNLLYLYQHETSNDADGQAMLPSLQTGYFVLDEADVKIFIDQVWADFRFGDLGGPQNATLQITFFVADYPTSTPLIYGPFTVTASSPPFLTPRLRGRLVAVAISSQDVGSFWRVGLIRYRFAPDGRF